MAYAGLLDGGLHIRLGDGAAWTGGTEVTSSVHGLQFETTLNGIGSASFWIEVADPFSVSQSYLWQGSRVNIWHVSDAVTTYLYKGFIINDPSRGIAGETARLMIECGGPVEVARWREDCAFSFTDADTQECWIINKRNNKVYTVNNGDCIEISVDKGDEVPSTGRGGIIGYVPYLGCQYMIGPDSANKFNGVKRITGQISTNLANNMRARFMWATKYTDERNVNASVYNSIRTFGDNAAEQHYNQKKFDTDDWTWEHACPTDGAKYLAVALYCMDVAGDKKKMTADRYIRLDNVQVYTGTYARRVDEAMLEIANWVNFHGTSFTGNIGSTIPSLVARPFTDPVSAINQFATQADNLVEWGWWPQLNVNDIEFRARYRKTNHGDIHDDANSFVVDATEPGVIWDVKPRPEDDYVEVKAVRLLYSRAGRNSDYPPGTKASTIAPADPGFRKTGGPFQGSTARVMTVDFTGRNYTPKAATAIARTVARLMRHADKSTGSVSSRTLTLKKSVDNSDYPWAYVRGGDFIHCTQDSGIGPLVITSSRVDVDAQTVDLDIGLPADALVRQLEGSGSVKRAKLHRR